MGGFLAGKSPSTKLVAGKQEYPEYVRDNVQRDTSTRMRFGTNGQRKETFLGKRY